MEKNEKTEKPEHEHGHEHHEHGHHEHGHEHHEHDHELVTITVDTKLYKIRHGQHTVVAIKQLAGVPLAYELEQLIAGKLTPLPDGATVTIKGGEVFLSHPKDGGAS
jgi:hypothetical protein